MAELKMDEFVKNVGQKVAEEIKQNYIKRDVLDKISAEIDQIDIFMGGADYPFIPKKLVLYIIDKYKGDKE